MEKNQDPVTQTEEKIEETVTEPVKKAEKTEDVKYFTQEEVNAIVLKAETKVNKKYEGVDLKKYKEWEDSQKTESEKQHEVLQENETLKNRVKELENMSVVANAQVDSKFQKFVLSEVVKIEGDFEDNLKNYLKENPQYVIAKEVETPKSTGVSTKKISENAETGVSAILKAKHPDLF